MHPDAVRAEALLADGRRVSLERLAGGLFGAFIPGAEAPAALSVAIPLRRRRDVGARRSLSLPADDWRGRSASLQRGHASPALERARRASSRDRRRARRVVRGVGAECAQRERGRPVRSVGWTAAAHAAARIVGRVRAVRAGHGAGIDVQVSASARARALRASRPIRSRSGWRRRPRPRHASSISRATSGAMASGWTRARRATAPSSRC